MRPGGLDLVPLLDPGIGAQDHSAHALLFEVEGETHDSARELEKLACHRTGQSVHAGDTVAHLHNCPDADGGDYLLKLLYLLSQDGANLVRSNCHGSLLLMSCERRAARR